MTPATKSRGIIFRGDMVRAILAGAKSQTRRIVKPTAKGCTVGVYSDSARGPYECVNVGDDGDPIDSEPIRCPYGVPGDELWVRETCDYTGSPDSWPHGTPVSANVVYRADDEATKPRWNGRWCSPRFMPRWASRLTLVVESVRVERLSAITEGDAEAEGFEASGTPFQVQQPNGSWEEDLLVVTARDQYLRAFRAMHKLAADADPWLWVIGFRKQGGAS